MMILRMTGLWLTLTIALAGCSPTASKLEMFGTASDKAVSLLALPAETSALALSQTNLNHNHCRYAAGQSYDLGSAPGAKPSALIQDQNQVASALSAYSKALAEALDADEEKEVLDAGAGLATAIGDAASEIDPSTQAPEVLGFIFNAILRIQAAQRLSEVKAEMEAVLPYLIVLEKNLRRDTDAVDAELARHIQNWETSARCVLRRSHRNDPATRALFVEFDTTKRTLDVNRKKASKASDALRVLKEAHFVVLGDTGTLDQGLEILNEFIAQIDAIKDA